LFLLARDRSFLYVEASLFQFCFQIERQSVSSTPFAGPSFLRSSDIRSGLKQLTVMVLQQLQGCRNCQMKVIWQLWSVYYFDPGHMCISNPGFGVVLTSLDKLRGKSQGC